MRPTSSGRTIERVPYSRSWARFRLCSPCIDQRHPVFDFDIRGAGSPVQICVHGNIDALLTRRCRQTGGRASIWPRWPPRPSAPARFAYSGRDARADRCSSHMHRGRVWRHHRPNGRSERGRNPQGRTARVARSIRRSAAWPGDAAGRRGPPATLAWACRRPRHVKRAHPAPPDVLTTLDPTRAGSDDQ